MKLSDKCQIDIRFFQLFSLWLSWFTLFFAANVKKEGERLAKEVEDLKPFKLIGKDGVEITIKYVCLRTMLDGKIKVFTKLASSELHSVEITEFFCQSDFT